MFCAVFTWCGRTPDLNGDCRSFAVAVDALANPGPLLELPSIRLVGSTLFWPFSRESPHSLELQFEGFNFSFGINFRNIYTPKLMVDSLAVPSSVNVDVQYPFLCL